MVMRPCAKTNIEQQATFAADQSASGLDWDNIEIPCTATSSARIGNVVNRLEAVVRQLDVHCESANSLLSGGTHASEAERTTGLSQGIQTDATIDYIDGLTPSLDNRALLFL